MGQANLRGAAKCFSACMLVCVCIVVPSVRAQTVEPSQQVNDRLKSLAGNAQHLPPPSDYVIGTGDLVGVQVFDVPEMSRDLRVGQTGTIGIPLVPVRLHVAGLTELQAERKIEEVLEANGLISHPEVSVVVREKKSKPITVVGAVGHPMVYSADRQVTLVEVLAEAGGISNDASDQVIITRPEHSAPESSDPPAIASDDPSASAPGALNSSSASTSAANSIATNPAQDSQAVPPPISPSMGTSTITVNLGQILESGDMASNIVLLPGDVVTVPHAGIVYVLGAVGRPGGYTVANDRAQLTTLKLLSLAGGLNHTAKGSHAYIVRKDGSGKQTQVEVDLQKVMKFQSEDLQLRPSDILYVPTSAAKTAAVRAAEASVGLASAVLLYRVAYH
jgi:polysaccharide biosynthesis/export protein